MNTTDYDDDGFVYIPKWMYRLDLTLSETAAYGIIYVFSQEKQGCYFGSLEYLARYCKVSRRHAINILKKLEDAGLIIRESHPGSTTHFYAVDKRTALKLHPCNNFTRENISPLPCNNFTPTRENISPNNKTDNKEDNIDTRSLPRTREETDGKNTYGEYVRMTVEEYVKLIDRFGTNDTIRLIEILDAYLSKNPNRYKSHYRAILGWPVERLQEGKLTAQRLKNAEGAAQRMAPPQPARPRFSYDEYQAKLKELEDRAKRNPNNTNH